MKQLQRVGDILLNIRIDRSGLVADLRDIKDSLGILSGEIVDSSLIRVGDLPELPAPKPEVLK